jgi:hypothetical protein
VSRFVATLERHDSAHEPVAERARRIPRLAEEHHLARRAEADQARQAVGREPRDDAVADGREPERRVRARDAEVAAERDLQATAEARPLDRGDGRDRNRFDLRERDVPSAEPIDAEAIACERRQIDARAERATFAGDDDRARLRIVPGARGGAIEVADRVVVGGVQLLGPRELEPTDAVAFRGRVACVRRAPRSRRHARML